MRVSRHKKFQRYMTFFKQQFQFKEPYQILVDGTFANAVLAVKVNMREQLPKYFDGICKLMVTPCTITETEKLGPSLYGALQILKSLQLHKCPHTDEPVPASECLKSILKKIAPRRKDKSLRKGVDNQFIVATQDGNLRAEFRKIIGTPLIYLYGNAPTLEKPSDSTVNWTEKREKRKLQVSTYQKEILQNIKDDLLPDNSTAKKGTKKRKRAGPNPLSCKKSKKDRDQESKCQTQEPAPSSSSEAATKKRKRIRLKVPKHVKEIKKTEV